MKWQSILLSLLVGLGITICLFIALSVAVAIDRHPNFNLTDFSYLGTIIAGLASVLGVILLYLTYQSQKKRTSSHTRGTTAAKG